MGKVKYCIKPKNESRSAKAAAVDLPTHYKNMYNCCQAVKGMEFTKAVTYLEAVLEKKRVIPFRRYCGGVGRTPQGNEFKHTQGRWPEKSVKMLIGLLKNAEANAESKNLDTEKLVISAIACNRSPPGRRRTYRAHGRVTPYQSSPCHIQLVLDEKEESVEKAETTKKEVKLTRKQLARKRLPVGGDA